MTSASGALHHTPVTLAGPLRRPRQMLADQTAAGRATIHDDSTAAALGFSGGPIEGPTHFSQFAPLAATLWGPRWFEEGWLSAHYQQVVVEGDEVRAFVEVPHHDAGYASIRAEKVDGTQVLTGTAGVGPPLEPTECERRVAAARQPEHLVILDRLTVGQRGRVVEKVRMEFDVPLGHLYPFTLRQKLEAITEPMAVYVGSAAASPWARPVIPLEMVGVLAAYTWGEAGFEVRQPSVALFLDQEIRLLRGPLYVGEVYFLDREIVAISESRRTESYWTKTAIRRHEDGEPVVTMLLHQGVLKDSYRPS